MDRNNLNAIRKHLDNDERYATVLRVRRALLRNPELFTLWEEDSSLGVRVGAKGALTKILKLRTITENTRGRIETWQSEMNKSSHPFSDRSIEESERALLSWPEAAVPA